MRCVRTTLPCTSMTVMATGTPCLTDSTSTRSARFFEMVSMSMVVGFLSSMNLSVSARVVEAQSADVRAESVFRVSWFLEPLLEEGLDPPLPGGSVYRGHAGVPAGSDLDVGRKAGFVHEAFGVGDRPLVEGGDAGCECADEVVQLGVRERTVHVPEAFGIGGADVVRAQ